MSANAQDQLLLAMLMAFAKRAGGNVKFKHSELEKMRGYSLDVVPNKSSFRVKVRKASA